MKIARVSYLVAVLAVGCGPNENDDGWVAGTYSKITSEGVHSTGMSKYTLAEDGRGEYFVHTACSPPSSFPFTWELDNKDAVRISAREGIGDEREQLLARTRGCGDSGLLEFVLTQLDERGVSVWEEVHYRSNPCLGDPSDPNCGPPGDECIEPSCRRFWCDDDPPERCEG